MSFRSVCSRKSMGSLRAQDGGRSPRRDTRAGLMTAEAEEHCQALIDEIVIRVTVFGLVFLLLAIVLIGGSLLMGSHMSLWLRLWT